jgi:vacuolar iron transporter family protein
VVSRDLHDLEHEAKDQELLQELGPDYQIESEPGAHRLEGEWIRDATLGANDGLVSILVLLAGVAGATTGRAVLVAGIAGLVAGAISMGVGAYVSAKAYRAYYRKELQREMREMHEIPDREREEIRGIYRERGFRGEELEMVVARITSDPKVWLRVMMQEELGLSAQFARPLGAAGVVFVAFLAGGIVPILPFIWWEGVGALIVSFAATAAALIVAGIIRTRFTGEHPAKASAELVLMAAVGLGAGYGIGKLIGLTGITE